MSNRICVYENSSITFQVGENLMVNATEMAKAFGKRPAAWLRLPSTVTFMAALGTMRKSHSLTQTIEGTNGGTWFHEDVAIEFARWLSPKFAIWCNDRIKELLRHGLTVTPSKMEELLANPDTMIATLTALKAARASADFERTEKELAQQTIQAQAPIVKYAEAVLQSTDLIATNVIAADLGMSAKTLNNKLKEKKIIYNQSGTYVLYSEYRSKGYADYRTHTYLDTSGTQHTTQHLYWTQAGRRFITETIASK